MSKTEKHYILNDKSENKKVILKKKLDKSGRLEEIKEANDYLLRSANGEIFSTDLDNNLIVSSSPHIFSKSTTTKIMLDVLIALMPAAIASVIIFGYKALILILVCMASSIFFEWGFQKITKQKVVIGDMSAAVTGLLLALNLPSSVPWWQAVIGSIVAVIVVKGLFGGIGKNFANPAITARVVMLLAFGATVAKAVGPTIVDTQTSATPLYILAHPEDGKLPSLLNMFLGLRGGAIGETCALALLIGGVYLVVRKVITWHTPVIYVGSVFILSLLFHSFDFKFALYQVLSGGLLIGAIFMATDYATTPSRPWGKVIFALGCAIITVAIRLWGSYPEGVSFSILFMNILTPYIDKLTRKRPLGGAR